MLWGKNEIKLKQSCSFLYGVTEYAFADLMALALQDFNNAEKFYLSKIRKWEKNK